MRIPSQKKNRIVQIEVTTRCCETCFNCTRALAQSPKFDMPLDLFEQAVLACKDWIIRENGRLALFGGNPTLWKHFDEGAEILAKHLPKRNMGLWTNNLHGKGEIVRRLFGREAMYNVVVHQNKEAAAEFTTELPWVKVHGVDKPSMHASLFCGSLPQLAPRDLWLRVDNCSYDINWSAIVVCEPSDFKTLGGYSCEIASTHARVNGKALGVPVTPGWLDLPLDSFRHQYEFACPRCSGCLNLNGVPDLGEGGRDQFSPINQNVMQLTISKTRKTELVSELPQHDLHRPTEYLQ